MSLHNVTPTPGPIAQLALLIVIPLSILAFSALSPTRAVLAIFLGSLLFLPELVFFDAPIIPPLDKQSIPALCMLIGVFVKARERVRVARIGRGIDLWWIVAILAVGATVATNNDPIRWANTLLPGYVPSDFFSDAIQTVFRVVVPFVLGRILFRTAADAIDLLRALVIGGMVYVPFILVELRLSPQWHNWIYGYGQHIFLQTVRGDGYRPMVFMAHGLALAMFMWAALVAGWALGRMRISVFGQSARWIRWVLTGVFPLLKSTASLVYGAVAVPFGALGPKTQLRLCAFLVFIVASYPLLRANDWFPTDTLVNLASKAGEDRAESLAFRFTNEDRLLTRALERPLFGWGTFGRNMVFDRYGAEISVIDGAWIALIGQFGIVGFAARFGLLVIPVVAAVRNLKRVRPDEQPLLATVAMLCSFYAIDLLPNGLFNPMPMFLAGAVAGLARGLTETTGQIDPALARRLLQALRNALPSPASYHRLR